MQGRKPKEEVIVKKPTNFKDKFLNFVPISGNFFGRKEEMPEKEIKPEKKHERKASITEEEK